MESWVTWRRRRKKQDKRGELMSFLALRSQRKICVITDLTLTWSGFTDLSSELSSVKQLLFDKWGHFKSHFALLKSLQTPARWSTNLIFNVKCEFTRCISISAATQEISEKAHHAGKENLRWAPFHCLHYQTLRERDECQRSAQSPNEEKRWWIQVKATNDLSQNDSANHKRGHMKRS